jgi:hypothetical protein
MDLTRKAGLGLALLTVAGLAATAPVQAQTLYSTGFSSSGTLLGNGDTDGNYTLTYLRTSAPTASSLASPGSTSAEVRTSAGGYPIDSVTGPYLADSTTSRWISPIVFDNAVGYYDYQTTFTLTPGQNSISGQWSTDNEGYNIYLNTTSTGNSIPNTLSYTSYTPFTISSGFIVGQNTLHFVVHNDGGHTALRVDGLQGATVAPEPSSFAVFGFLGLGMAGLMLKARKRSMASATA